MEPVYATVLRDLLTCGEPGKMAGESVYHTDTLMVYRTPYPTCLAPCFAAQTAKYLTAHAKGKKRAKAFGIPGNPDGTLNSAYGHALNQPTVGKSKFAKHSPLTPFGYAAATLMKDKDAIAAMPFRLPSHCYFINHDLPRALYGLWSIAHDKLNLWVTETDSDAINQLPYDLPFYATLPELMAYQLRNHYPGLTCGELTYECHKLYIKSDDMVFARSMLYG